MKRAVRIVILVLVIGFLISLMVYNSLHPAKADFTPWNEAMTLGNKDEAKYHYIMYTDISCPYCSKFSWALAQHEEEFKSKYIEGEKIYYEIRLTDTNYENGHSNNSRPAAEASYCAARQNKFWEYYHGLLKKLYEDYHSKGIGIDKTSKPIPTLENDYFKDIAKDIEEIDLDSFNSCFDNHETVDEIDTNTRLAQTKINGGIPYFVFNNVPFNGFAGSFDADSAWENYAKPMLDSGLTNK